MAWRRRREWPTRLIQRVQTFAQNNIIAEALSPEGRFQPPALLSILARIPGLRRLPARLIGYGPRPEFLSPAVTVASGAQPSRLQVRATETAVFQD
jgi:hypothetical protein